MPSQVFSPTGLTTTQYSGAVTAIDEFPHSGVDRLQNSASIPSAGTVTFEVAFDLSGSLNFNGHLNAVLAHAGTASGGVSTSAQLKVGGANVGAPVVRDRVGSANLVRYSQFHWPASVMSSIAADPDGVSVAFTTTNLHASGAGHHVHAVALLVGTVAPEPSVPGVNWSQVVEAWVPALSDNYLAHNDALMMVPGLKGGVHLFSQLSVANPTYLTNDAQLDHAVVFNNGRLAFTFNLAEPGLDDFWCVNLLKTPNPLPTGDSNSQGAMCGIEAMALGGAQANTVIMSYSGGSLGTASWLVMTGSVGGESDHLRSNAPSPADAWAILMTRLNQSGNDSVHKHDMDGAAMVAGDKIIDAEPANGNPAGYMSFGLGSRSTADRNWLGRWAGTIFLDGSLTEAQALVQANAFAAAAGLVDVVANGSTATINIDAQGAGVADEGPPLGGDPVPPPPPADWVMLLRCDPEPIGGTDVFTSMEVPYHEQLLDSAGAPSEYGWRSADRDGYRVGYGFLFYIDEAEDEFVPVIRYAFVGGYAVPGEAFSTVVFDQGGTDWTRYLWDGTPWDPDTQGHEANDAPVFAPFAAQSRPNERPVIRMVHTPTGQVVELRNYAALPMEPGIELNQLAHITTPFADRGRRPDSIAHTVYDRIQIGTYMDGENLHGIYYDCIHPDYRQLSTLDEVSEVHSGGSTAIIQVDALATQGPPVTPQNPDPPTPTGQHFTVKLRRDPAPVGVADRLWDQDFFTLLFGGGGWRHGDLEEYRGTYLFLDRGDGNLIGRITMVAVPEGSAASLVTAENGTLTTAYRYDGTAFEDPDGRDMPAFSTIYPQTIAAGERPAIRFIHAATGTVLEVIDFNLVTPYDGLVEFEQQAHIIVPFQVTGARADSVAHTVFERITVVGYYNGEQAIVMHFDILRSPYRMSSTADDSIVTSGGSTAVIEIDALANAAAGGSVADIHIDSFATGFGFHPTGGATAQINVDAEGAGTSTQGFSGGSTAQINIDAQSAAAAGFSGGSTAVIEVEALAVGAAGYQGPFVGSVEAVRDFAPLDVT